MVFGPADDTGVSWLFIQNSWNHPQVGIWSPVSAPKSKKIMRQVKLMSKTHSLSGVKGYINPTVVDIFSWLFWKKRSSETHPEMLKHLNEEKNKLFIWCWLWWPTFTKAVAFPWKETGPMSATASYYKDVCACLHFGNMYESQNFFFFFFLFCLIHAGFLAEKHWAKLMTVTWG